jgi:hypothetical protein
LLSVALRVRGSAQRTVLCPVGGVRCATLYRGETEPFAYEHAEQIVYRDIDATVLTPGGIDDPDYGVHTWFAPVAATFPAAGDGLPRQSRGPDPEVGSVLGH